MCFGTCNTLELCLIYRPLKGLHSLSTSTERPNPCYYGNSEQRHFLSSLQGRAKPISSSIFTVSFKIKPAAQPLCPMTEGIPSLFGATSPETYSLINLPPLFIWSESPEWCLHFIPLFSARSLSELWQLNRGLLAFRPAA